MLAYAQIYKFKRKEKEKGQKEKEKKKPLLEKENNLFTRSNKRPTLLGS